MSWSVYLALVLFFDYNIATHKMIRSISAFPVELVERFNNGLSLTAAENAAFLGPQNEDVEQMLSALDEQGLRSLKTMLLLEYARCTRLPGDAVIKAFDGAEFTLPSAPLSEKAAVALQSIKHQNG